MAKKRDNAKTQRVREELWKTFFHEIEELLENLEAQLLSLESDQKNLELIAGLFRTMHTIKGTCGMMGLGNIEGLAHKAEDVMDLVRDQKLALNDDMMDLMFEALDTFKAGKALIVECKSDESLPISQELVNRLQDYLKQAAGGGQTPPATQATVTSDSALCSDALSSDDSHDTDLWQQLAQECVEQLDNSETLCLHLESFPEDAATIDSLFRVLHSLKGSFNLAGLSNTTQLLHLAEDLVGLTRDGTTKADQNITDALLAVIDLVRSHLNEHRDQRADLEAHSITENQETLKALILSIDPERSTERLEASQEPQLTVGDGQIEIDAEYLEIFFEIVWRSLNAVKQALQNATDDNRTETLAELKEDLEEIIHAAEQMQLNDTSSIVNEFLSLLSTDVSTDKLIEKSNELWHFFWDLEESLPARLAQTNTDAENTAQETPAAGGATNTALGNETQLADDFFDGLWPELATLRKSIEQLPNTPDTSDALKQVVAIEKLTGPVQELDLSQWLGILKQGLTTSAGTTHHDELAKAVQEIYTLCWDQEDQLQGSNITILRPSTAQEIDATQSTPPEDDQRSANATSPTPAPESTGTSKAPEDFTPAEGTTETITETTTEITAESTAESTNEQMSAQVTEHTDEPATPQDTDDYAAPMDSYIPSDLAADPMLLTQDPLFALDFLEKAQEDMGNYQKLKLLWQKDAPEIGQQIANHLQQFADTAQRLGFLALQNTIQDFIQAQAQSQWVFDNQNSKHFELTVFGLLTKIEESLPESVSNRHHNELNISHIFKQWHANQFFHTLEDCSNALEELKSQCLRWQQGQLNESDLNLKIKQAHSYIESIIFTCQYHALSEAEEILLHVSDTLVRTEYDKTRFNVDQINAIAGLMKHIGNAVHSINETGTHQAGHIEAAYESFKSFFGHETNDAHIHTAKQFFETLTLPECVADVLSESVMSTVGKKLADSENLFLLFIDIEHDEVLAEKTFELLESGAFETIVNATDYVDDRSAFHFLVHSRAAEAHLAQLLKKIDASGEYLRIQALKPKTTETSPATPAPSQESESALGTSLNRTNVDSPELTASLEGLQGTVGELISVKANLVQLSQSMSSFDLFEFIDKEVAKCEGNWQKAKEQVRSYLQNYDTDLKDLIKAQEDVGHVLDKLQQDVNSIREVPVSTLLADIQNWFNQTPGDSSNDPKVKIGSPDLRIERNLLQNLNLPLRQLLFLFKKFSEKNPKAQFVLTAHAGSQYNTIEMQCEQTEISLSLLQAWGLPDTTDPSQWLREAERLPNTVAENGEEPCIDLGELRKTLREHNVKLDFQCDVSGWQGFVLQVPTDNNVIDGITVIAQNTYYIFPVQLVKRIINLDEANRVDASASHHKELIEVDHNVIPLMRLKQSTQASPERQIVLILSHDDVQRAIVVDELVGLQQVLVTPLEGQLASAAQYQGCAVLGKDRIGMVISANALF